MTDGVRVVSFDAGGTLLEPWPSVGAVYARALEEAGYGAFDPVTVDAAFRAAWRGRGTFGYGRDDWRRLVEQTFAGMTGRVGEPGFFEVLWEAFAHAASWRVFPEVPSVLETMARQGLRLVVVSNWDERLHRVLRECGLATRFERVFASVEWQAAKPDRRFFEAVRRELGVDGRSILHVGDGWVEDWEGAVGAGWRAVWLDRDGRGGGMRTLESLVVDGGLSATDSSRSAADSGV